MKLPLQITTRNVSLSQTAADTIRNKTEKLETFFRDIIACRVMVEVPHRHKNHGMLYNIRLDITVPGSELVVRREPNEDIYVAIRDAFDAARRQLQSYAKKRRGEVKSHTQDLPVKPASADDQGPINAETLRVSEFADWPSVTNDVDYRNPEVTVAVS